MGWQATPEPAAPGAWAATWQVGRGRGPGRRKEGSTPAPCLPHPAARLLHFLHLLRPPLHLAPHSALRAQGRRRQARGQGVAGSRGAARRRAGRQGEGGRACAACRHEPSATCHVHPPALCPLPQRRPPVVCSSRSQPAPGCAPGPRCAPGRTRPALHAAGGAQGSGGSRRTVDVRRWAAGARAARVPGPLLPGRPPTSLTDAVHLVLHAQVGSGRVARHAAGRPQAAAARRRLQAAAGAHGERGAHPWARRACRSAPRPQRHLGAGVRAGRGAGVSAGQGPGPWRGQERALQGAG